MSHENAEQCHEGATVKDFNHPNATLIKYLFLIVLCLIKSELHVLVFSNFNINCSYVHWRTAESSKQVDKHLPLNLNHVSL